MKVLIVYFTISGNTAEIAQAMGDHAKTLGHSVDVNPLSDVKVADFDAYDTVLLGSACHDSDLAKPVIALLNTLPQSPSYSLAGCVTHSTMMQDYPQYGHFYKRWAGKCLPTFERVCEEKAIPFKGYFHCQGRPSAPVGQFIRNDHLDRRRVDVLYGCSGTTPRCAGYYGCAGVC